MKELGDKSKKIMKEMDIKDLGVKVRTKEGLIWFNVAKEAKLVIENLEKGLIVQGGLLQMAELKVKIEEEKMNR